MRYCIFAGVPRPLSPSLAGRRPAPSYAEAIARAPSPFAVEGLLDDFRRFAREASPKTCAQLEETSRVRLCELRGVLP